MDIPARVAFVDVETTGLRPGVDRIAEVAVVVLDGTTVQRWSSTIDAFRGGHAPTSSRATHAEWTTAPRFADVAAALAERLEGALVVAHNARFDHAFLRAELALAGIAFAPRMVCSVMLSRRLSPDLARHDLDSLARAHGLAVTVRHRALPDAELLLAWWQQVVLRMPVPIVAHAVRMLLAGPLLPAALDPGAVEALPDIPGAFRMLDDGDAVLHAGAATNLRVHVIDYFRVGHASGRALAIAHRVRRIDWRATRSALGARLHALQDRPARAAAGSPVTWRLVPDARPCVTLAPCGEGEETFGCFASGREAERALARMAARDGLCHCLLGLVAAGEDVADGACCGAGTDPIARSRALLRIFAALRPRRIERWPHAGPIVLHERGDLLVIDRWRFVGSARVASDVDTLRTDRPHDFDPRTYRLLVRALARSKPAAVVSLARSATRPSSRGERVASDPGSCAVVKAYPLHEE